MKKILSNYFKFIVISILTVFCMSTVGVSAASQFTSQLIKPNTWLIQGGGCNCYLLVGTKSALMIDSGMSYENIRAYAQTLTSMPVTTVVNTHGHFDHTGGNMWFDKVYMNVKAIESAKVPYSSLDASKFKTDYPVYTVSDEYKFDLGDREVEVIDVPAHQAGSIALLDKKERILFSGDEMTKNIALTWHSVEQPYVEQHYFNMLKLKNRISEYDTVWTGHDPTAFNASDIINGLLAIDLQVMQGKEGDEIPAEVFTGDKSVPDPEYKRIFKYNGYALVYDIRYVNLKNVE
jgi:hydroxyacylglutathione hydrolase